MTDNLSEPSIENSFPISTALKIVKYVIFEIEERQKSFHKHFFLTRTEKQIFNLKKKRVEHVYCPHKLIIIDEELSEYCLEYRDILNTYDVKLEIQKKISSIKQSNFPELQHMEILKSRVKQSSSVIEKWKKYAQSPRHKQGNVPLKKCLNDLMGYRLVISNRDEVVPLLEEYIATKSNLKFLHADKGNYKATHVYFHEGNTSFPWELQIWDFKDFRVNHLSHERYKQGYLEELEMPDEWERIEQDEKEKLSRL